MKAITTDNLSSDFTLDIQSKKIKINKDSISPSSNNAAGQATIVNNEYHMFVGGLPKKSFDEFDRFVVLDKNRRLAVIDTGDTEANYLLGDFGIHTSVETIARLVGSELSNTRKGVISSTIYFDLIIAEDAAPHSILVEFETDGEITVSRDYGSTYPVTDSITYGNTEGSGKATILYKFPNNEHYPRDNPLRSVITIESKKASYFRYITKEYSLPGGPESRAEQYAKAEAEPNKQYRVSRGGELRLPYPPTNSAPIFDAEGQRGTPPHPVHGSIIDLSIEHHPTYTFSEMVFTDDEDNKYITSVDKVPNRERLMLSGHRKFSNQNHSDIINLVPSITLKGRKFNIPNASSIRVLAAGNGTVSSTSDIENPKMLNIISRTNDDTLSETYRVWRFHRDAEDYKYVPISDTESETGCTFKDGKLTFNEGYSSAVVIITLNSDVVNPPYIKDSPIYLKLATLSKENDVTATINIGSIQVEELDSENVTYNSLADEYFTEEHINDKYQLKYKHLYSNKAYSLGINLEGDFKVYSKGDIKFDGYRDLDSVGMDRFISDTTVTRLEKTVIKLKEGKEYRFKLSGSNEIPFMVGKINIAPDGSVHVTKDNTRDDGFDSELLSISFEEKSYLDEAEDNSEHTTETHHVGTSEVRDDE